MVGQNWNVCLQHLDSFHLPCQSLPCSKYKTEEVAYSKYLLCARNHTVSHLVPKTILQRITIYSSLQTTKLRHKRLNHLLRNRVSGRAKTWSQISLSLLGASEIEINVLIFFFILLLVLFWSKCMCSFDLLCLPACIWNVTHLRQATEWLKGSYYDSRMNKG